MCTYPGVATCLGHCGSSVYAYFMELYWGKYCDIASKHHVSNIITLRTCARGKFVSRHCSQRKNRQIWRSRCLSDSQVQHIIRRYRRKNWLHYAMNRLSRPMSVTNTSFCWPRLSKLPTMTIMIGIFSFSLHEV